MRRRGRQVRASICRIRFGQLSECRVPDQHGVAFNEREIGSNDDLGPREDHEQSAVADLELLSLDEPIGQRGRRLADGFSRSDR